MTAPYAAGSPLRFGGLPEPQLGQVVTFAGGTRHGLVAAVWYTLDDLRMLDVWEHTSDPALQGDVPVPSSDCAVATVPGCSYCPTTGG